MCSKGAERELAFYVQSRERFDVTRAKGTEMTMQRTLGSPRHALRGLSSSPADRAPRPRYRRRLHLEWLEGRMLLSTGVTAASGGGAISADTAATSFTTLSGPAIDDTDISTGTIILNAPAGFVFNTDVADPPTVSVTYESGAGTDVVGSITSVTASQITYTVITAGSNEDLLTWQNVQVQPAAGTPLANGNIYETGTSSVEVVTQGSGGTNFGTLTEVAGAAAQLNFIQQPMNTVYGSTISPAVTVAIEDQFGNLTNSTASVSLTLNADPTPSGTNPQSAVNGIATFDDLGVNKVGENYSLEAESTGLSPANSDDFDITPAQLTIIPTSDGKVYDGTTTSTASPTVVGLVGDDTVSDLSEAFTSNNVQGIDGSTLEVTGYTINDGNDGANYSVTTESAAGTITPAALTITATTDSKVYDGTTTSTAIPTVVGLVGDETVSDLSEAFTSNNVQGIDGSTLEVTGYTINDGNDGANYSVTTESAAGTISPAALTITASTDTTIYDGTTSSMAIPTIAGLVGDDTVSDLSEAFTSKNVMGVDGSTLEVAVGYTINDGNDGANYTVTTESAAGTIAPAALTITASTDTKVYDGTTTSTASPTVVGLVGDDTVSDLSEAFTSNNVQGLDGSTLEVTGYTINDGNDGGNYSVTTESAAGTITPAALTITATTDSKVYDGTTTSAAIPTVVGLVGDDTVSDLSEAFTSNNVQGLDGSTLEVTGYTINDGNDGANYSVTTESAAGTITPAALTITASTDTKLYDGTTSSMAIPTIAGLVGDDTVSDLSEAFTSKDVMGADGSTLEVTGYTINDGNDGANYTVTTESAAGTITPAALTLTATTDSKIYDGTTTSTAIPTVVGLVGDDTVSDLSEAFTSKNVMGVDGSTLEVAVGYTINDGNDGANYSVTTESAAGTITPAALTLTATTDSKVYDGTTTSTAIPTVVGLVGDDTVSDLSEAFTSKNVMGVDGSTLEVSVGYTINDGNDGANYSVTTESAAGTITPAALTITADSTTKTYGGAVTFDGTEFTESGLVSGDTVTSVALTSLGASATASVGGSPYAVIPSDAVGTGLGNYTITYDNGSLTVSPAPLTITADSTSKTYGATVTFNGTEFTDSGLLNSDTVTSVTLTSPGALATANVAGSPYAITPSAAVGTGLANYAITYDSGSLAVGRAALTITADSTSKTYGDTATFDGTEFTDSGLLNSDTVTSVTLTSPGALATANVAGSPYGITPSAAVGTGLDNYTITYDSGSLTVNRAALTITADSSSKTYGDTVTFDGTEFTDSGLLNSDAVTSVTLTSPGANSTAAVTGSPYAIIPSSAVGTGLSNYTITYVNGSLAVTPTVLTVSIAAANKVYDGTTSATLTNETLNGLVGSDQVSLSGGTATFANKNAGNLKTVTDTGLSLTGADVSNYVLSPALVTTTANIAPAPLTITANNQTEPFGNPVPPLTVSYAGFVGGDTPASLSTPVQLVTTATSNSPAGAYAIIPSGAGASNYAISYVDGTMNVSSYIPLPSPKGRAADSFIATLYEQVLGRGPEPSGLQYWVGKRLKGMPQKQIWRQFVKSVERHALEAAGLAPSIPVGVAYTDAVRADQSAQTSGRVSVRVASGHVNPKPAAIVRHHGGKR
jgi:trimeric autotransporter adhesin